MSTSTSISNSASVSTANSTAAEPEVPGGGDGEGGGGDPATDTAPDTTPGVTGTIPATGQPTVLTPGSAGLVEVENEAVPLAATVPGAGAEPAVLRNRTELPGGDGLAEEDELIAIEEEEVPLAVMELDGEDEEETEELTDIAEEDTPLAAKILEEEGKKSGKIWWSIIPFIIAAVTGKTVYDKKYKKGIFAVKDEKEDTDDTK